MNFLIRITINFFINKPWLFIYPVFKEIVEMMSLTLFVETTVFIDFYFI